MTGWQSGGGDQGGWNPNQSFGPEAQTNRYNDPYANQQDPYNYGSDPYPGLQDQYPHGTDPYAGAYGQYQQPPHQQPQYPPTGGFPTQGYGPPPQPPKRSKLPMILSLVAIVIIVGAVVAIVLVNRGGSQPAAQDGDKSSSSPAPSKDPSSSGKKPTTSTSGGGDHGDWIAIDNTADSTLSYQVPPDWQRSDASIDGKGIKFTGVGAYGIYDCEGGNYTRTFAASGDVQGKNGKDLDLATTVEDFAEAFATVGYGDGVKVDVPKPTEVKIGDRTGMMLTAKVTVTATKPNCQATEAEVGIVGVPVQAKGQPKGVAMLVVVNDLKGGPPDPKTLDTSVTQDILGTVKAG
ncbi:hypothetical protein [Actinophytocola sp.]|uniref:hypothetical protein n=1 Tax=Actinophytocola sp. TaxID=1872138 RepID=UPI002D247EB3|nr:hypothetical protein [Actinophytocola sp.]HYQ67097.1 hypothetical protein [Actinophytocola sp.]